MGDPNELINKLDRRSTHEMPFIRNDGTMTIAEYDKELHYLNEHLDDVKKGLYIPLWKQKPK